MEKKFTKREWEYEIKGNKSAIIHATDTAFAEVFLGYDADNIEELQANAKLICAAPNLLQALEAFEKALTISPIEFILTKELSQASELARAAIKKALS